MAEETPDEEDRDIDDTENRRMTKELPKNNLN